MSDGLPPQHLAGWTYEAVLKLCARGRSESDRHDFKLNLPDSANLTKLCCAFANTFGGFVVVGVKETSESQFDIIGITPDKELYGKFLAKVKAEPDIQITMPSQISIPESSSLLYVFEVLQSSRRPHLPTTSDQRVFWKRQGSDCVQMTLEEIRYQMISYEEKREKLALLLIDLHHKVVALEDQSKTPKGNFTGDIFTFEIADRVVAEAYALLKDDVVSIGALETIRRCLQLVNIEKQRMMSIISMSYDEGYKLAAMERVRETSEKVLPQIVILSDQIERSFQERLGIANPYKHR